MAGWQSYISSLEQSKARISYAAIYGKAGGKWAETVDKTNFPTTDEEIMIGVRALVNQDTSIMGTGLKMAGHKFACILIDTDVLVCQGKEEGKKDMSLVFALTEQAVIIGYNPEGQIKTAMVRDHVERMKDYLRRNGY